MSRESDEDPYRKLYRDVLTCRETAHTTHVPDAVFDPETLKIVFQPKEPCSTLVDHAEPYDSRRYQIPYPIVYVQGTDDPATPPTHAFYHFDGQTQAPTKVMLGVSHSSHGVLESEGKRCALGFWQALSPVAIASGWRRRSPLAASKSHRANAVALSSRTRES